jgi:hypothetical protein
VLRRIFGPKRDEVMGGWRKLSNEFHNLYSSLSIIKMLKSKENAMVSACSTHGEKRNAYRILVGKPENKGSLERPRHRCESNNNMNLRKTGWGGMDWINLAQERDQWRALVNMVMYCGFHKMLGYSWVP